MRFHVLVVLAALATPAALPSDARANNNQMQFTNPGSANYIGPRNVYGPKFQARREATRAQRRTARWKANVSLMAHAGARDWGQAKESLRDVSLNGGGTIAKLWGGYLALRLSLRRDRAGAAEVKQLVRFPQPR